MIFSCQSEFIAKKLDLKTRARIENTETVATGIYYQTNIYTIDLRH